MAVTRTRSSIVNGLFAVTYIPQPTDRDYDHGYIRRYFARQANNIHAPIIEINEKQYKSYGAPNSGLARSFYTVTSLNWRISGPRDPVFNSDGTMRDIGVMASNEQMIRDAEYRFFGIHNKLINLLEFWRYQEQPANENNLNILTSRPTSADSHSDVLFAYDTGDNISELDISFTRASTATYRDAAGLIQTAAVDALRDNDYVLNPVTGLYERSTLLEGQRTNREVVSNPDASWNGTGLTITPNTLETTSPSGANDAAKLTTTQGSGTRRAYRGTSPGAGVVQPNTLSVYAKAGSVSAFTLFLTNARAAYGLSPIQATYNLATGTVSGATNCTGTTTAVGDGWYRCTLTFTEAGETGVSASAIYLDQGSAAGDSIYAWGMQFERGASFASSYIPTTGSAVTRETDALDLSGVTWTAQECTQYIRYCDVTTNEFKDTILRFNGTTPQFTLTDVAITHFRVYAGEYTIQEIRNRLNL